MKTTVLIFLISVFFVSCRPSDKKDTVFCADQAAVCSVDTIRDFNISKLVNSKNKVNLKVLKNETPVTISDLQALNDTVFCFNIEPSSAAKGLTIAGNAVFCYDKAGKLSEIFFHSLDSKRIFVWPDNFAALSKVSNPDNADLVAQLFSKMQRHWTAHVEYMKPREFPGCINLELLHKKSIYMLGENDCEVSRGRFDISSLTGRDGKIYAIADKPNTRDIYEVDTLKGKFYLTLAYKTTNITSEDLDFEVIDVLGDKFILADEIHDLLYVQRSKGAEEFDSLRINFTSLGEDMRLWSGNNAGIEGMTVDNKNYLLYIAKERNPRRMFVYDMKKGKLTAPYDKEILPDDGDISDLCYENGFLYILDRQNCLVRKFDVKTKKSVYASFRKFSNNGTLHNYHADYGMAEALWLTKDAVYVGFDNNADPVTKFGEEVGLQKGSTKPSIFVFKRPKGF
ncbi:MAG: SdiA-regulated domain-containing protein [Bacteroidales bacterium]|nr:SdiA-regulated domain-containing protein [Bacteroidales bacterium]